MSERAPSLLRPLRARGRTASGFLAAACALGYVVVGHGVGDFYPFSPLGMFKNVVTRSSRLAVRDAGGHIAEIGRFAAWHCDAPLDFSAQAHPACGDLDFSAYDDIVRDHILSHPGAPGDGEPIEIVRRVFEVKEPLGPVSVTDCPLLACTAKRADPTRWTSRL